ncbi:hypothetical protein FACS1894181_15890 [Bacteroidia bacterium]|nr:hypothetical protein FACS1894181_15890 [Bacteroidia bacterium]
MKRFFLILFALVSLSALSVKAQVTIGADRPPHPGAVLELESNGRKGLLLSNVTLTKADNWSLGGSEVDGMMVYNESGSTTDGLKGKGIYVWTGHKWNMTHETPCSGAPVLSSITLSPASTLAGFVPINTLFTCSVPQVAGVVSYEWILPPELKGQSNTNVISLAGIKTGYCEIRVKAINACGTGNEQKLGLTIL